jgi:hypothetical protein
MFDAIVCSHRQCFLSKTPEVTGGQEFYATANSGICIRMQTFLEEHKLFADKTYLAAATKLEGPRS